MQETPVVERTLGPNDRMYVFADDYDALTVMHAKLLKARDLSAIASATMRDESVAKSKRIAELEAVLRSQSNPEGNAK